MEDGKFTQEELLEAEAAFNLATLLGKSLQAAVYSINHPDNGPDGVAWSDVPDTQPDEDGDLLDDDDLIDDDEAEEDTFIPDPVGGADGPGLPVIHSNEENVDIQVEQTICLYHPAMQEFLKGCALYEMLHIALEQFHFDLSKEEFEQDQELSSADKRRVALAWIIVKRVFAVRHTDEALLIIAGTEKPIREAKREAFKPMDEVDKQFITETIALLADPVFPIEEEEPETTEALTATFDTISQIPPQDTRYIALASKAFREQRAIAARNRFTPVDVGNATIQARIGKDGEPPVELSEFEMLVEQAIGEIIQYQTRLYGEKCLPIAISPEQLYRWVVYDGSSSTTVTSRERQMVIDAFDKLIHTPAELHILEQLENHTRLKSKPGYKKLLKNEGVMVGNLVTGIRVSTYRYSDKIINDALVISFMPMFFYYSAFTGQLLKVDRKLLTGEAIKASPARNTAYDSILRSHILYRVDLIKKEMQNRNRKIIHQGKYSGGRQRPLASFTKVILLSSLAEECKVSLASKKKLEVFRNKVLAYMQELEAQGEIKSFEPKYESRKITGVSITV